MDKIRKSLQIIYIIIFFAVCITPLAMFPFVQNTDMIEKTELASVPHIFKNNSINTGFSSDCNDYINDHFPYRSEMLFASNHMLSDVFKSPSANVITGSRGWLFYEETADDYMGTNLMTDNELDSMVVTLSLINEQVSANGGHFVFAPVPNKNSIYSNFMPIFYPKAASGNLERLYTRLEKSDISYVNLKSKFLQAISFDNSSLNNPKVTYYHKKDSHWNNLGAELGYNTIMEAIDDDFIPSNLTYTASYFWDGDLEKLLYPKWGAKDLQYAMDYPLTPYEFIKPSVPMDTDTLLAELMSDKEENDSMIVTKHLDSPTESELYMVRDSFGRALLPFMINRYDTATFARTDCPYIATLNEGCDVVYEIVERNLNNVISTAPYMYAPLRDDIPYPDNMYLSVNNLAIATDEGYAYRIYGTVDKEMSGNDARIYVRLTGSNASYIFEAFPIYESSLLGDNTNESLGYSLMLDSDEIVTGDYEVQVISGDKITDCLVTVSIDGINPSDSVSDDDPDSIVNDEESAEVDIEVPVYNSRDLTNLSGFDLILEKSAIIYNNTAIHLNDNIYDISASLGKLSAPTVSVESCITGTVAREYYYPSLTINTLEDGTIFSIEVKDNGYSGDVPATTEGITLGSTAKDISEAVGSDYLVISDNPTCYAYSDSDISIYYYFDNNRVSDISITDTGYQVTNGSTDSETSVGYTPLVNGSFVIENYTNNMTGWKLIDGVYQYYDRNTGERITGTVVNGISIAPDGSISHDANTIARIDVMMKARWVVESNTLPTDSLEEKRLKVFNWILSFPYKQHRKLNAIYQTTDNLDILFANDIFVYGSGDCVSESAALAFLFKELGYDDVYFCHDTGHSWVMLNGNVFDPLFAEARGFENNYDVIPEDYRRNPPHKIFIP